MDLENIHVTSKPQQAANFNNNIVRDTMKLIYVTGEAGDDWMIDNSLVHTHQPQQSEIFFSLEPFHPRKHTVMK